jgi:ribonucleoside-diphosphate reductase alpha chain
MPDEAFQNALARQIWETRYRYDAGGPDGEQTIGDTWRRVARALAAAETVNQSTWAERFEALLRGFDFLPGGRILAGAGTDLDVTLFNCFVMGRIDDSIDGIFDALKEGAVTMQHGGGVGYDFSTLRPCGAPAWRVGGSASGPVSFMRVWDTMCETLLSTASRRGAMMATLRCDHPDIATFVEAKRDPTELRNFNLSVQVSDDFMEAVADDRSWPLVFPVSRRPESATAEARLLDYRPWPGRAGPAPCAVFERVPARGLWDRIMRAAYETAEPGVLFVDRINRENNLAYRESISATNPCGEIPLPAYGACNLGSLNLVRFVRGAFTGRARLDLPALSAATATAVRMLDDVVDRSRFPLAAQAEQARGSRRIGLGLTGLADALILLGLRYDSEAARDVAATAMACIRDAAYRTSVDLALERGCFPFFEREPYLDAPFIRRLPAVIRDRIARDGIRNSHLTAIAPTGTISLLANNVSSGIEPMLALSSRRRVRGGDGRYRWHRVQDYALGLWRADRGDAPLPEAFVSAAELDPADHLSMQAALQPFVDSAISKTINVPERFDFDRFRAIYREAYRLGLKGCTTFRPNPVTGAVLVNDEPSAHRRAAALQARCCAPERDD